MNRFVYRYKVERGQRLCFLNNVFLSSNKPNTKRIKTGIILNSQVKKQVLIFFSKLLLVASVKNIKQNTQENIVQCWTWFYKTSIKIVMPN